MQIKKIGTYVSFSCQSCGTEYVVGIRNASTPDHGENYYCDCPVCGAECHADINAVAGDRSRTKRAEGREDNG